MWYLLCSLRKFDFIKFSSRSVRSWVSCSLFPHTGISPLLWLCFYCTCLLAVALFQMYSSMSVSAFPITRKFPFTRRYMLVCSSTPYHPYDTNQSYINFRKNHLIILMSYTISWRHQSEATLFYCFPFFSSCFCHIWWYILGLSRPIFCPQPSRIQHPFFSDSDRKYW